MTSAMDGNSRVISLFRCPSLEDVVSIVDNAHVVVEDNVIEALDRSRRSYVEAVKRGDQVYGYCTGLGELLGKRSEKCDSEWEKHVLLEHSMTIGDAVPKTLVRAFLAVRLYQLARGRAPVRGIVLRRIAEALNNDFIPVVHRHGSVGASGDLAPSAEAFLCLFYGEGQAYNGEDIVPCKELMEKLGIQPLPLEPGEALALINNTAWSTALGILGYESLRRLWNRSIEASVHTLSVTGCNEQHYSSETLHATLHEGVRKVGEEINQGITRCEKRRLQDPYSLRCTPQVLGAVSEALNFAKRLLEEELCSSTENPIIVNGEVKHWCGFHSIHVALAIDTMKLASTYIANLTERRLNQLLRSEITGLPEFLAGEMDSVGAMITQYAAASLTARIRWLANPQSTHSIPTSGLQEDIVPVSPESGYELLEAVRLLAYILSIEFAVSKYASENMERGVGGLKRLIEEYNDALQREIYP